MTPLLQLITEETAAPVFPAAQAFAHHLAKSYPGTAAILFYGSCLRLGTDRDLMMDFYVLVDRMGSAIANPISALGGALLPPNVYYIELPFEDRVLRAKVAVMSFASFVSGTEAFVSAIWARFSQRCAILNARNDQIRARLDAALAAAAAKMIAEAMPQMPARFDARMLWVRALEETYGAELRPEPPTKAASLVDENLLHYRALTAAALGAPDNDGNWENKNPAPRGWTWPARSALGKALNLLRLIKAAFTFRGGLDYAVWKIERHSGVKIELTDTERRHPILTGLKLLRRTMKSGGLR